MNCRNFPLIVLLAFHGADRASSAVVAAPDIALTPTSLNLTYQIGDAQPAARPVAVKSTGTTSLAFTLAVTQPAACSAPCLTISGNTGKTPAALQVYLNPTGLVAGTYTAKITITAPAALTAIQTVNVTVSVFDAQSSLSAQPTAVMYSYTTGTAITVQTKQVLLASSANALTATVAVAGGAWLSATPTAIIALTGNPQTLTIAVDPTGMVPSLTPYKGTVTVSSSNALNKTVVIDVALTVNAGIPTIASPNGIWPPGAPAGSAKPVTITITGTNYTAASTVISATTPLTNITVVNATTILATIPVSLLAATGSVPIVIHTPSAAADSTAVNFLAYDPAIPQVWAVVNSASYHGGTVSPGGIVTIYGAGMGPAGVTSYPAGALSLPFSIGVGGFNTSVTIDGKPAPLLYTSPTQISCVVPLTVTVGVPKVDVYVTYNAVKSLAAFKVSAVAADPGIFTLDPSGQAAVLNIDTSVTPNDYSVNAKKNAASAGSWVAIYATGFGLTSCLPAALPVSSCDVAPTEALFVTGGTVKPIGAVAVTIGGQSAVSAVGVVPVGSTIGLLQINAQLPAVVTAGDAVPVVISIGGVLSVGNATMVVK